ncbi:MAG: hypothetical protein KDA96_06170 [Planctomycetaceae bacterium]|nr:hypothetical protein [Planctomycetaceae bacterium]
MAGGKNRSGDSNPDFSFLSSDDATSAPVEQSGFDPEVNETSAGPVADFCQLSDVSDGRPVFESVETVDESFDETKDVIKPEVIDHVADEAAASTTRSAKQSSSPKPETTTETKPSANVKPRTQQTQSEATVSGGRSRKEPNRKSEDETAPPEAQTGASSADHEAPQATAASGVPGRLTSIVMGYAIALTLLVLVLLISGRLRFSSVHPLESLPDLRPLDSNEFQKVPEGTELPDGHVLNLGQSQRYGDVVFTPVRVTREKLTFHHSRTNQPAEILTTRPVLKLWFECRNVNDEFAFPAWDNWLMSSRSPAESIDDSTAANSWLMVFNGKDEKDGANQSSDGVRVLNYLQSPHNEFLIDGQEAGQSIAPGQTGISFAACAESINDQKVDEQTEYRWRLQVRKGVHEASGHGVTTLVEVAFSGRDIQSQQ